MEGGKAGVHSSIEFLDPRVRGNDRNGAKRTFNEGVKIAVYPVNEYEIRDIPAHEANGDEVFSG